MIFIQSSSNCYGSFISNLICFDVSEKYKKDLPEMFSLAMLWFTFKAVASAIAPSSLMLFSLMLTKSTKQKYVPERLSWVIYWFTFKAVAIALAPSFPILSPLRLINEVQKQNTYENKWVQL